jgi:hypothetical protein
VSESYLAGDFERAVAVVSAEPSPRQLVERFGIDWDYLAWLALDASATVLGEEREQRGSVVSYGGEAFTAGFLIGVHLPDPPRVLPDRLGRAVDAVQERGRQAVIADHCDLSSVAHLETVYADALLESMEVEGRHDELLAPVTRIFEAGLAVGLAVGSDGDGEAAAEQP